MMLALLVAGCGQTEDEKAAPLMQRIDSLYASKDYQATLNAIRKLRHDYPRAIKSRERALTIWQDASLKMAQEDVGRTDSALQATTARWRAAKTIRERNQLKVKVDSLQVRYDALCGTIRVIHRRQEELK
jgi:hypothetical protein